MSLFGGKTVVSTSVQTVPLIDKLPPNRILEAVREATKNKVDITDAIKYQTLTGYGRDLTSCFNYAKTNYIYGLPTSSNGDEFIPIVPIRYDDVNVNTDKTKSLYKTTKNLLRTTKVNLDVFTDSVTKEYNHKNELVDIEDLDKISDIFIIYGVNVYSNSQVQRKVLFNLFSSLESEEGTKLQFEEAYQNSEEFTPSTLLLDEKTFDYDLVYNYVVKTTEQGRVSKLGDYTTSHIYGGVYNIPEEDGNPSLSYHLGEFTISYQNRLNSYVKLTMHGLHLYHTVKTVRGDRSFIIPLQNYTEGATLTDEQKNLIVPLRKVDIEGLLINESDELVASSRHLIIYSSDSQYLKWYQTQTFATLIEFASLVFLLVDLSGTTSQILMKIATALVIQYAFELVLTRLFEHFSGNEDAQLLLTIIAIYASFQLSSSSDFSKLDTAEQLVKTVDSTSTVVNTYTEVQLEGLNKEYELFRKDYEALQTEIDYYQDTLNTDYSIFTDTEFQRYEEPDDFFKRTLNTSAGQLTFDQLHNYVDNNLNLEYIR